MSEPATLTRRAATALPDGGAFIAVVGPSGAGKDTLIDLARAALGDSVRFVRRTVTRPADASSEDHDTMDPHAFAQARDNGLFALSWSAHGLEYGLPADIDETIAAGGVVVANVSRGAIEAIRDRYARVVVVLVTAGPEVLAERLAGRGRESRQDILARLARKPAWRPQGEVVTIVNEGAADAAGSSLVTLILAQMKAKPAAL